MGLDEELGRAAAAAAALGLVSAVLAAETAAGERAYLLALGLDDDRRWLVVDDDGAVVGDRERVREVASLVILCELAVELADEVRAGLLHRAGSPPPSDRGGAALAELERAIGAPPRVASATYLDRVGEAARGLEHALGELSSPLAGALAAHAPAVDAFVAEVESRHRLPLR